MFVYYALSGLNLRFLIINYGDFALQFHLAFRAASKTNVMILVLVSFFKMTIIRLEG